MMYRTLGMAQTIPGTFWEETPTHLVVTWTTIERLLGHPYEFTLEDDQALFDALRAANGPAWLGTTAGIVNEQGWVLEKPQRRKQ